MKSNINLVELIGETVKLKKVGREWQGCCPYHHDTTPSLKVDEEKGLWNCFSCNIGGTAYDWVMKRDSITFAEAKRRLDGYLTGEKVVVATYDYTDPDGKLLFQVVRYFPKSFSQRQPDDKGGWVNNLKGVESVLYKLPALAAAEVVWLCEGEKDANRLIAEGLVATTSPGGAGNWKPQYAAALQGKKVIAVPHNDAEGERYINQAMTSLKHVAREVQVCRLPGLDPKGDVSDWLDVGNDVRDLEKHCQQPDTEPRLEVKGGIYEFTWAAFAATMSRVREDRHGQTSAEVRVSTTTPGLDPVLTQSKLNLLSPRSQADLAKRLVEKAPSQDWEHIIELICQETLEAIRQGEPAVEIVTDTEALPEDLKYLLWPLLPEDKIAMIFGEGGTGKTTVAALVVIAVTLPWFDNPLHLVTSATVSPVLVLDWENELSDWKRLVGLLCQGQGLGNISFRYRRCGRPFADDFEAIQRQVVEHNIRLVVVDSVGEACGGDLREEVTLPFFRALRGLKGVSILLIHHTSKDKAEKRKTPFGSAYFWNQTRSIWEIRHVHEPGETEMEVALFHRKANFSQAFKPLAYHFTFAPGAIVVTGKPITSVKEFLAQLSHPQQILAYFRMDGRPKSVAELHETLDIPANSIAVALGRLKDKGQTVLLDGKWALAAKV